MSRASRSSPSNQLASTESPLPSPITLKGPFKLEGPLKLEMSDTVKIAVLSLPQPESQRPMILAWLFASFTAILIYIAGILMWLNYVYPPNPTPRAYLEKQNLSVSLMHPQFAAYGDENEIDVTITNCGAVASSGELSILFSFVDARPLPTEKTTITYEKLPSGASYTQRMKFALAQSPSINSQFEVCLSDGWRRYCHAQIKRTAIPNVRRIISILFNTVTIGAVLALFFEAAKRFYETKS